MVLRPSEDPQVNDLYQIIPILEVKNSCYTERGDSTRTYRSVYVVELF